jgi:hypothetical protein
MDNKDDFMTPVIRRLLTGIAVGLLGLGAAGLGVATTGGTAAAATSPCQNATPKSYQHVVWILMENKAYTDIIGNPNAKYLNSLATQCEIAHVQAATHPSLPNYIALTSGSTQGITDDNNPSAHPLNVPSIFSQLNGNWRSYAQSMPAPCNLTNSGNYAVRHVPATYYTNIRSLCKTHVLPYSGLPNLGAAFTMITPNLINDMHSGGSLQQQIKTGDTYLSTFLPKLFASSTYKAGRTLVLITWDEGRGTNNTVAGIFISPSFKPTLLPNMSSVDVLHFTENQLSLPPL